MALGLVLVGILAGLMTAVAVMVLGGGFGFAVLGYVGGGLAGMLGGAVGALVPRNRIGFVATRDHG